MSISKTQWIIAGSVLLIILIGVLVFRSGNASTTFIAMDTKITISAKGHKAAKAVKEAKNLVKDLDGKLNKNNENSDVYKINHGNIISNKFIETYELVNFSMKFSASTLGVFDITVAPLVDLYKNGGTPTATQIDNARKFVDYKKVLTAVAKSEPLETGFQIDLGGIAKGYAADKVESIFKDYGLEKYTINLGGDVVVANDKLYKIGIQSPFDEKKVFGVVSAQDCAIATSGIYERGTHIVDPLTGKPASAGVASATVIAEDCATADALSTVLFITGKSGLSTIEKSGAYGILIMENGDVFNSNGANFKIR